MARHDHTVIPRRTLRSPDAAVIEPRLSRSFRIEQVAAVYQNGTSHALCQPAQIQMRELLSLIHI